MLKVTFTPIVVILVGPSLHVASSENVTVSLSVLVKGALVRIDLLVEHVECFKYYTQTKVSWYAR
jgi:hypothetical protein